MPNLFEGCKIFVLTEHFHEVLQVGLILAFTRQPIEVFEETVELIGGVLLEVTAVLGGCCQGPDNAVGCYDKLQEIKSCTIIRSTSPPSDPASRCTSWTFA